MHSISFPLPNPFDFVATVTDHGWYDLAPWRWRPESEILERVERLPSGHVVLLSISPQENNLVIEFSDGLNLTDQKAVCLAVKRSLRLDQDFHRFYSAAQNNANQTLWESIKHGRGRLMRTPTLFEDVIKMICTTNINWAQTRQMSQRLCDVLGSSLPADSQRKAFPTPAQISDASDQIFSEQIRLGYRNTSVQHLAKEIDGGNFDLECLNQTELRGAALQKEFQKLNGVGPYASAALAGLIGDYTYLPVDSAYREHVRNKYFGGDKTVPDKELMAIYEGWGEWKQLAYWFDR